MGISQEAVDAMFEPLSVLDMLSHIENSMKYMATQDEVDKEALVKILTKDLERLRKKAEDAEALLQAFRRSPSHVFY